MGKSDDQIESFGYPPKTEEKVEAPEKQGKVDTPKPMKRTKFKGLLFFPMALGTAGLAYSIYFIFTFFAFGSVESFFPWEWQVTCSSVSLAVATFAAGIAVSLALLVPSSIKFDGRQKARIVESNAADQNDTIVPEEQQPPEDELDMLTIDDLARDLKESKVTAKELKNHIARVETVLEKKIEDLGLARKSQRPDIKREKEPAGKVEKESSNPKIKEPTPEQPPVTRNELERKSERRDARVKLREDLRSVSAEHDKITEEQMEPLNS
jgi:hypothetical protein